MEKMKVKFNIKEAKDWGGVRVEDIHRFGGGSILSYYYNNSLFNCLRSVYPGIATSKHCHSSRNGMETRMVSKTPFVPKFFLEVSR